MIFSVIILVMSAAMFAYWFRYTCQLILHTASAKDLAGEVAEANSLHYPHVLESLGEEAGSIRLDGLKELLHHDYAFLSGILGAAGGGPGDASLERLMLKVDYLMMRTWYAVNRRYSPRRCREALEEMSSIVSYFAQSVGERAMVAG